MTLSTVAATHARLALALRQPDALVLDLDAVTEADLSFIQLIEAARHAAAQTGGDLSLAQPASPAVRETLRRGGFLDDDTSDRALFWLQGATTQ